MIAALKMNSFFVILVVLVQSAAHGFSQMEFTIGLFDGGRNRVVPVTVYQPEKESSETKVIIFNHGYDGNGNVKSSQAYSYLNRFLAGKGYYVISIQHELPQDPLLAMEGNLMEARMPNWERGVENILFAIQEFRKLKPGLDWGKLILIGHSNGGDMVMLFAARHPLLVDKAISLDHRRMKMPRIRKPRLYTLRGCDYEADEGVLPGIKEQEEFHMRVVKLEGVTHSGMGGGGTEKQHELVNRFVLEFIK